MAEHGNSYAENDLLDNSQMLLHTDAFYTHNPLRTNAFTHTHALLQTHPFSHKRFYTKMLLHTDTLTRRSVYAETLLHTHTLAQKQLIELLMWNASHVQNHFS